MLMVFLLLCGLSTLAAGLFGAVHNQLSYTIGPDYFHGFKFHQFALPEDLHSRLGAALVGWRASWWMGLAAGLPAFALGLAILSQPRIFLSAGLGAIVMVLGVTTLAALSGLVLGWIWIDDALAQTIPTPLAVSDKIAFLRAGVMHDLAYGGGILGAILAIYMMFKARMKERKFHET